MIIQFIHGRMQGRGEKAGLMIPHGVKKAVAVAQKILPVAVAVLFHTGQKPGYRLHESIIIHHRIPLIPLKPRARLPIVFCQDQRVRIGLFHGLTEFFPEGMVKLRGVAQIRRHIQAPSVRVIRRGNPFSGHPENVLRQFLGFFIVQFRKGIVAPPAVIEFIVRPAVLI